MDIPGETTESKKEAIDYGSDSYYEGFILNSMKHGKGKMIYPVSYLLVKFGIESG
jgi:hypothetical protein